MRFWNEYRVESLKTLYREGLSASEIGKKVGCSRNAVIGKLNRMNGYSKATPKKPRIKPPVSAANIIRLVEPAKPRLPSCLMRELPSTLRGQGLHPPLDYKSFGT